jgi:hypothetical protein
MASHSRVFGYNFHLLGLVAICSLGACKKEGESGAKRAAPAAAVKYLPAVRVATEAFSWTLNDPIAKDKPKSHIMTKMKDAIKLNIEAGHGRLEGGLEVGHGFYAAGDPFASMISGNTCVVVPIRLGEANIADVIGLDDDLASFDKTVLSPDVSGVFFDFGGSTFAGGNVIAFRDAKALDIEQARSFSTDVQEPKPFAAHDPLRKVDKQKDYESLITQFGDHRSYVQFLALNIELVAAESARAKSLPDAAILEAVASDMIQGREQTDVAFRGVTQREYPVCWAILHEEVADPVLNTPIAKRMGCVGAYVAALHAVSLDQDRYELEMGQPDDQLKVEEVRKFMIAAGSLAGASNAQEFKVLVKEVVKQFREGTGSAVLESMTGPMLEIKKHFVQTTFSNWVAPAPVTEE